MARDLNKIVLLGRLGGEVELRHTAAAQSVANFSLATNNRYVTAAGDKRDDVSWHRIIIWGKLADVAAKYLHKGSRLYLEGRLSYRKWTDPQGVERMACEIVADEIIMLDGSPGGSRDSVESAETADVPF